MRLCKNDIYIYNEELVNHFEKSKQLKTTKCYLLFQHFTQLTFTGIDPRAMTKYPFIFMKV